jgi:hypothetical protein
MKKFVLFAIMTLLFMSCISQEDRHDGRDKYCGEYNLHKLYSHRIFYSNGEFDRVYEDVGGNGYNQLIISKDRSDTTSLILEIVTPFDTAHANRIKRRNEEIRKKNAESICGEDIEELIVPVPNYRDSMTLTQSLNAYVKGHKIFIKNHNKYDSYHGETKRFEYDSVYLRNDSLYFTEYVEYKYEYSSIEAYDKWKYVAIKKK